MSEQADRERVWLDRKLQGYAVEEIAEEAGVDRDEVARSIARQLGGEDIDVVRLETLLTVVFPVAMTGAPGAVENAIAIITAKRAIEKTKPRSKAAESLDEVLASTVG
jgi:hypothetical protein